ncbi:unnamed protein product, partial [Candidula unifasciata]
AIIAEILPTTLQQSALMVLFQKGATSANPQEHLIADCPFKDSTSPSSASAPSSSSVLQRRPRNGNNNGNTENGYSGSGHATGGMSSHHV